MLIYPNPDKFFDNCLEQCGLSDSLHRAALSLQNVHQDEALQRELARTLYDIMTGADTILKRGKPSGQTLEFSEWERHFQAWASSRVAAFYTRAALLMLGEKEHFAYFLETLRSTDNLAFLGASSDVLQHASGYYLTGAEEELSKTKLADFWQQRGL